MKGINKAVQGVFATDFLFSHFEGARLRRMCKTHFDFVKVMRKDIVTNKMVLWAKIDERLPSFIESYRRIGKATQEICES